MNQLVEILKETFPSTTISVNESEKRIKFSVNFLNKAEILTLAKHGHLYNGLAVKRSGTKVTVIVKL